jgi:hypothetical protein
LILQLRNKRFFIWQAIVEAVPFLRNGSFLKSGEWKVDPAWAGENEKNHSTDMKKMKLKAFQVIETLFFFHPITDNS